MKTFSEKAHHYRKKIISVVLAFTILLNLFVVALPEGGIKWFEASAETSGTCGYNLTWEISDGTLTISGAGTMTDYNFPDFLSPWHSERDNISRIVISSGVTSIGDYAFWCCDSLTSTTIPDSVTSVGDSAFSGCESLTSITIPDSVTLIGDGAFGWCASLTSVTIPDSVTSIGDRAFYDCDSLTGIYVGEKNQYYIDFNGILCDKKQAELICCPSGFPESSVNIPEWVTSIGDEAFTDCTALTSITIPDSVTSIGNAAFCASAALTSITIPDSVTSVGDSAFSGCESLTSITIPDSVTLIGDGAFSGCTSLTGINIPNSVTSIGSNAFTWCDSLSSINIPHSVTLIGDGAFSGCTSLTSINIPDSVTSIGNSIFINCDALIGIYVDKNNQTYGDINGILYDKKQAKLICCPCAYPESSVNIPEWVTSIVDEAFSGCTSLTSITISESVTLIGDYAFGWCDSLIGITIPDSVTLIGSNAFWACGSLTNISIYNRNCNIFDSEDTIHYNATIHGYIGSTAQAYAEKYDRKFVPLNAIIFDSDGVPHSIDTYKITVTNSKKQPVAGASVTLEGINGTTAEDGTVTLTKSSGFSSTAELTIDAAGFAKYQIGTYAIKNTQSDVIAIGGQLVSSVIMSQYGKDVDILTTSRTIDIAANTWTIDITPNIADTKNLESVHIAQYAPGSQSMISTIESVEGVFKDVSPIAFKPGYICYLVVKYKNDGEYRFKLRLSVVNSLDELLEFEMPNTGGVSFGSSYGGLLSNLEIDIPGFNFPAKISYGEKNVYVGINLKGMITEYETEASSGKWDLSYNKLINIFDKSTLGEFTPSEEASQAEIDKAFEDVVRNWDSFKEKEKAKKRYTTLKDYNAKVITGYVIIPNLESFAFPEQTKELGGRLLVSLSTKQTASGQFYPFSIPTVVELDAKGQIDAQGNLIVIFTPNEKTRLTGDITLKGKIDVTGKVGVGLKDIVSASIYGRVGVDAEYVFLSINGPSNRWKKAIATGSIGAVIKVLWAEKEFEWAEGKLDLLDMTGISASNYSLRSAASPSPLARMYDTSAYTPANRDYLAERSEWQGESSNGNTGGLWSAFASLFSAARQAESITINPLQESSYTSIVPQLVKCEDTIMLVYADDIAERTANDRTAVVYSIYDSANDSWSQPVMIEDDGTADFSPVVHSDGEGIWVAWQNAPTLIADDADLTETAKTFELRASRFDPETGSWTAPANVTNNISYETHQQFASLNGTTYLTWVTNSQDDLFGLNSENVLHYAACSEDAWGADTIIAENLDTVCSLAAGILDDELYFAVVCDDDCNLSTGGDRTISLYSADGNVKSFTDDEFDDSSPAFVEFAGSRRLSWISGGNMYLLDSAEGEPAAVECSDAPVILDNSAFIVADGEKAAIVYTATMDESAQLYTVTYDSTLSEWGDPVAVTDQERYIKDVSAVYSDDDLITVFNVAEASASEGSVSESYDLSWAKISPYSDLVIDFVDLNYSAVKPGDSVALYVDVTNNGNRTVDSFNFEVTDDNGNLLGTKSIDRAVISGCSDTFAIEFTAPEDITDDSLNVTVANADGSFDVSEEDNTVAFRIGYADLTVEGNRVIIDNSDSLLITVFNEGNLPASGTLTLTNQAGDSLFTADVPELQPGEMLQYSSSIDKTAYFTGESNTDVITCTVTSDAAESCEDNNFCYITTENHDDYVSHIEADVSLVTIGVGAEHSPEYTITPSNADNKNVILESDDENIAAIQNGCVVGVSEGTAVITITTEDGGLTSQFEVVVVNSTIEIPESIEPLNIGESIRITAVTNPEDVLINWTSSDDSVASVSSDGLVTAEGAGTAVITASVGNATAVCNVTVIDNTGSDITVEDPDSTQVDIIVSDDAEFEVDGEQIDASDVTVIISEKEPDEESEIFIGDADGKVIGIDLKDGNNSDVEISAGELIVRIPFDDTAVHPDTDNYKYAIYKNGETGFIEIPCSVAVSGVSFETQSGGNFVLVISEKSTTSPDTPEATEVALNVLFSGKVGGTAASVTMTPTVGTVVTGSIAFAVGGGSAVVNAVNGTSYVLNVTKPGHTSYVDKSFVAGTDSLPAIINLYAGDTNADNSINAKDQAAMTEVFGLASTDSKYTVNADFNEDGYINAKDRADILANFGKSGTVIE